MKKKIEPLENVIQLFYKPNKNSTTNKIPECNAFFVVKLITEYYVDRYEIWKYASTGEVFLTKYIGQVLVKTEVTYKNMAVAYPCDSEYGNDDIHIPYLSKNYQTVFKENADIIEEKIDDSKLDPCTKAIMEKLKNATHSDIAKMLSRFAPATSFFNINMSIGQVKDIRNWAETTPAKGLYTDVNMVFSEDYINGVGNPNRPTDLSIATTMAHEMIHAYLISLVKDHSMCGSKAICDFPTIYDAYVQDQIKKNTNILPEAHHELIAKQYVFAIATTIQEFHTGQYTDYPYQNYLDIAWGGLQDTYIFNKNYPDDPTHKNYKDRLRIMAKINTEKLGTQYGIYSPLGTPCKK